MRLPWAFQQGDESAGCMVFLMTFAAVLAEAAEAAEPPPRTLDAWCRHTCGHWCGQCWRSSMPGLSTGMRALQRGCCSPVTIPAVAFQKLLDGQYLRLQVSQAHHDGNPDFRWSCPFYRALACKGTRDLRRCSTHEISLHPIQCFDADWQAFAMNPALCKHLVHICRGTVHGLCQSIAPAARACPHTTFVPMPVNASETSRPRFLGPKKNALLRSKSGTIIEHNII